MADLLARFKLIDEMSDKMSSMAERGQNMATQWERAGDAANAAFEGVSGSVASATSAADSVATSIGNIHEAANNAASSADNLSDRINDYGEAASEAASQTDYWTDAVGNYDKSALEAVYSTQELVEMGLKSADALEEQNQMMELCERSASSLSQAMEATTTIQNKLSDTVEDADKAITELADNENVSAETKEELAKAAERAQEAMDNLVRAQDEADAAMEAYNQTISSGTQDLRQLEAAAEQAAHAAENLAEANGEATDATDELSRATEQASEEANNGGQSGIDAIEGIAGALAAAGITAKVTEIATAVYDLADSFSEAEKTIIAQTGATGQELDKLMDSSLNVFASSSAESLNDVAASMTTVQTATKLTGDALEEATQSALTLESALGLEVSETTRTASALMKNFGIEAQEAYDIIAAGAQQGANQNGDLLDVLNEYSAQYAALGLSAEEFISSLVDGADAGVFSVDKVGDAVKEFNIRVKDGSDTTTEAFEMLGMNADTMASRFAAGGETARTAFFEVVNALDSMTDPIEKNTAAVNLFGTMYEDLGAGILPVLAGIEGGSVETSNALSSMADEAQSLGDKWQEAGNSISTAFTSAVEPAVSGISGALAEAAQGIGDFLNEHPAVTKAITAVGVGLGVVVVGIGAVSVASLTAIPAVAALGTAISAAIWPITAIAAAIAVVSGVVMSLTQDYDTLNGETAGMTAATREQYYELQDLNAEYEEAVEKYGENSEEALRLKYQVDELSSSFENSRQTVEEFTAEVDTLVESVSSVTDEFNNALTEINAQETGTLALIQQYEDLTKQTELTAGQQEQLEAISKKLADTYPDLTKQLDEATIGTEDYATAMKKLCEQQAEEQRQQEAQTTYIEALQKRAELTEEIAKAQENVNLEQERMDDMSTWDHIWTTNEWDDLDEYEAALEELQAAEEENEATIARIEEGWEDIAAAEEAAAGEAMSWQDAVSTAYEGVRSRIEELCTAYDEAYQAALESFEGQFGLFDEASTSSEEYLNATVANAQAAMDSQLAYWDTYLSNVETLKATSAEDLGITQQNYEALMAYAQSGSEEAAGLAQSMVDAINSGNEAAVAELANTVGEVQAKQQEASAAVADWQTSFSESLSSLEQEMQTAVESMDLSEEAQASAQATISAYVEQIRSSGGEASAAAESVAQQIETALATQIDPEVEVDVNYEANMESLEALEIPDKTGEATYKLDSAAVDDYVMPDKTAEAEYELNSAAVDEYTPDDKSADAIYDVNSYNVDTWNPPDKTATLTYNIQTVGSVPGHAEGTTNAENVFVAGEEGPELIARRVEAYANGTTDSTDFFIAGENGPELIVGEQGSTVFPAEETNRLINALNGIERDSRPVIYNSSYSGQNDISNSYDDRTEYTTYEGDSTFNTYEDVGNSYTYEGDSSFNAYNNDTVNNSYAGDIYNSSYEGYRNIYTYEGDSISNGYSYGGDTYDGDSISNGYSYGGDTYEGDSISNGYSYGGDTYEGDSISNGYSYGGDTYEGDSISNFYTYEEGGNITDWFESSIYDNARRYTESIADRKTPESIEEYRMDPKEKSSEQTKRILLEIVGSGSVEIGGNRDVDKDTILEILYNYLKPVLMSIIQNEIYEEGDLTYEY